jgi:hypothetical protein
MLSCLWAYGLRIPLKALTPPFDYSVAAPASVNRSQVVPPLSPATMITLSLSLRIGNSGFDEGRAGPQRL